jgi:hypothetical protein
VRSRKVWILKVESLVLKKKREYERKKGVDTHEELPYKKCRAPTSMTPYNPSARPRSMCSCKSIGHCDTL